MGLTFRRAIKLAGLAGLRFNFGKAGLTSVSTGNRWARVGVNRQGVYHSASLPGTGLGYRAGSAESEATRSDYVEAFGEFEVEFRRLQSVMICAIDARDAVLLLATLRDAMTLLAGVRSALERDESPELDKSGERSKLDDLESSLQELERSIPFDVATRDPEKVSVTSQAATQASSKPPGKESWFWGGFLRAVVALLLVGIVATVASGILEAVWGR